MAVLDIPTVRVCPNCGYSHLRASRKVSPLEQAQAWWTGTGWVRCETCRWRGRLRDIWDPDTAFPDLPPLKIGRDMNIEQLQQRDETSLVELVLAHAKELQGALRIWLDDSRPAPSGWLRLSSVPNAQRVIEAGLAVEISLDYDLGWCEDCLRRGEHLKHTGQRHCPHTATGYDLVEWMATSGCWPKYPPTVHSGNREGGARMLGVIARHWHGAVPADAPAAPPDAPPPPPVAPPTLHGSLDSSAIAPLTKCPHCGGAHLYRTHRRSSLDRLRTLLTRRYPFRCDACGWTRWSAGPILVRLSSGAEVPAERIETALFERIDLD